MYNVGKQNDYLSIAIATTRIELNWYKNTLRYLILNKIKLLLFYSIVAKAVWYMWSESFYRSKY